MNSFSIKFFQYYTTFNLKRKEQISILLHPKHYVKKKSVEKTSMVRFRKGIFKNNSGTVTLDGNSDLWAENLKGVLKLKHMLGEYRKLFRSPQILVIGNLLLLFFKHQSKMKTLHLRKKNPPSPRHHTNATNQTIFHLFLIL